MAGAHVFRPGLTALCVVALGALIAIPASSAATGDRGLRVIQTTELRLKDPSNPAIPTNGEVRVAVLVDEAGKLQDLLLLGSSHRAFTEAAVAALQEWRFEAPIQEGTPIPVRTTLRLFFESRGRVVSIQGGDAFNAFLSEGPDRTFVSRQAERDELDGPLQTTQVVRPPFPAQLTGKLDGRASVWVDFYVDETGQPRMPVVTASDHPLLSLVALDALDRWRFSPPTRKRHPVVVRVKQQFVFKDTTTPPPDWLGAM